VIRVVRSTGASVADADGTVILEVSGVSELNRRLRELASVLSEVERDALREAAKSLHVDEAATIVLASRGSVFRIHRDAPESTASPEGDVPAMPDWLARDRETPVVLVDARAVPDVVRDAFLFLGYNATVEVVNPGAAPDALAAVRERKPALLVLGESIAAWSARLRAECGARVAIVAFARSVNAAAPALPEGADAVLEIPLRIERVAPVLEPLLSKLRA
jgi:hypothetical protein